MQHLNSMELSMLVLSVKVRVAVVELSRKLDQGRCTPQLLVPLQVFHLVMDILMLREEIIGKLLSRCSL